MIPIQLYLLVKLKKIYVDSVVKWIQNLSVQSAIMLNTVQKNVKLMIGNYLTTNQSAFNI
jgi:hypothetical protein